MNKCSHFVVAVVFSFFASSYAIDIPILEMKVAQWLNTSPISLQELHGGLTNATLMAANQMNSFVVRVGKEKPEVLGIDRYCEEVCQKSASIAGIAPDVIYSDPQKGMLIRAFISGKALTKDDVRNPKQLKNIIQLIKKCHQIPYQKEFVTCSIYEKLRAMMSLSSSYTPSLLSSEELEKTKTIVNQIEKHFQDKEKLYAGLCHCDLLPSNIIDDGKQLWIIDWEYATWNNILFDLADLCVEAEFDEQLTKTVLELYFGQTWQEHYNDFILMRAIFNLRNAFWYDLRGKEIASIGEVSMADYAKRHLDLFRCDASAEFLSTVSK